MSDELPELPAELAQMLATERDAPPPSEITRTAVLGDVRVTISREGRGKRVMRSITPQLGFIAAFALGVGAVLVAIRPRSPTEDLLHVQPLDAIPETATSGPLRPAPRPVPLGTGTGIAPPPALRSPVLAPPLVLPTLPPPPRIAPRTDAGVFASDAAVAFRDTTLEEDALLSMARSALAHRDPASAFGAIRLHLARFPDGHLAEEREALAIRALVLSGHDAEAGARARLFREAYPGSLFLRTVDDALGSSRAPH